VRVATTTLFLSVAIPLSHAVEPLPGSDVWLTNAPPLPKPFTAASADSFRTLRAEAIAGRLRVSWESTGPVRHAQIIASADAPGHWPARDWRSTAMTSHGTNWQAELPVDSLHVPLIYFLVASNDGRFTASPMRIAQPGALGLEQPTRIFWPFVEGFEQGFEGWRVLHGPPLRGGPGAKHGRAALAIQIPPGERSVTIATTRPRGWFAQEHRASGLELWLRTRTGRGHAVLEVLANAFTTNQQMARVAEPVAVSARWTRAELRFARLPKFPLTDLDLFSIELIGEPGTEFLIDDVQWVGRWRTEF